MKEPQLHTIIKDKMGVGWQRTPAGWAKCGDKNNKFYSWKQLCKLKDKESPTYPELFSDKIVILWEPNS